MGFWLLYYYELKTRGIRMCSVLAEEANDLEQDVQKVPVPEPIVGFGELDAAISGVLNLREVRQ